MDNVQKHNICSRKLPVLRLMTETETVYETLLIENTQDDGKSPKIIVLVVCNSSKFYGCQIYSELFR
jgi:hypothetical protein